MGEERRGEDMIGEGRREEHRGGDERRGEVTMGMRGEGAWHSCDGWGGLR